MGETARNSNRGEYYTPKHISDLLFNITSKYLQGFDRKYTIWDNCWGTGNLTANRDFYKLFCSTIQKSDLRKNKDKNPNATKFQYDFLNSDTEQLQSNQAMWLGENKLPQELDEILRDKNGEPVLFYINPPYVATGIYGPDTIETKEGQTSSIMKDIMRNHKMQSACDQAYAQFLYKINLMQEAYENKSISIAVICPQLLLTASTYGNFRARFLKNFKFNGGALFKANEFEGLSGKWAISIQIYTPGETEDKKNFNFDTYELVEKEMIKTGSKIIYNLDGERTCMEWAKDELKSDNLVIAQHTLSSGCKISDKKKVSWDVNSIGYMFYKGNNIYHNENELGLMSLPYGDGSGYSITKENFDKSMSILCARRVYGRYGANWINDKDEYCVPDTASKAYKKLFANSIVYNLFDRASHMASLIIKNDDGSIMQVPNEFHHISLEETLRAFEQYGVKVTGPGDLVDRHGTIKLAQALESGLITEKGYDVLEEYKRLWEKTIPLRRDFNNKNTDYQVCNWDAGYYQIKWIIKEHYMEEFKQFQVIYRQFEESIRYLVEECGFLR